MAEQLVINASGMKGIVGENLTASTALEYGSAFGSYLKDKFTAPNLSVCIGMDSRPGGQMLKSAVTAGLTAIGVDVIDLGLVTTPCVGISLRELGCCGGIVITASYNPVEYNGIKLLLDEGIAPLPEESEKIMRYFFDKKFSYADQLHIGKVTTDNQADSRHLSKVLGIVDKALISGKEFKVAFDSVNGTGGRITTKLLNELGCEVSAINYEPTGVFAHAPELTMENLSDFCSAVKSKSAQAGFAQDPEASLLAIVDENGQYIGWQYSLPLAAKYIFSKNTGVAAAGLSTSRMLDDIAEKAGGSVIRTAAGEANVARAMLKNNCIIGGDGNGGITDLRVGTGSDSLVGIALVLQLMAETGKTISQLVSEIDGYYMLKENFAVEQSQVQSILNSAKSKFASALVSDIDGYRFDFKDGWLHIRASNSEPILQIIAEANELSFAQDYIKQVKALIN